MKFKTKPREKQFVALARSEGKRNFAYFMEMRTGKTKVTLDDAARAAEKGKIDCLLVLAPNGVHRQWVVDAVPEHMATTSDAAFYSASGKVAAKKHWEATLTGNTDNFRVLTMNIESAANKKGQEQILYALKRYNCMFVIDESDMIKTPSAKRSRFLMSASKYATARRILTGTPITQSPLDLYSQFKFLSPAIIGFDTFAAFRARYAVLLDASDFRAMAIARKTLSTKSLKQLNWMYNKNVPSADYVAFEYPAEAIKAIMVMCPECALPPITALDDEGNKMYQNMAELEGKVSPYVYRLRAAECTDLPTLVPMTLYTEITPEQRRIYKELEDQAVARLSPPPTKDVVDDILQWYLDNDRVEASNALTLILRAQQVLGGWVKNTEGEIRSIDHNRIKTLMDFIHQPQGKVIIWARFRPEIEEIVLALSEEFGPASVIQFHGGISQDARDDNKKAFQNQNSGVMFLVGQAAAGGVGQTFDAADTVIFYSNMTSARMRWQAEVRASAIGKESIAIIDIVAPGTIDEKIIKSLAYCRKQAEEFNYE